MSSFVRKLGEGESLSFPWGQIRWLFHQGISPGTEMTCGLVFVEPGQKNPYHLHPNCEEILYVLSGECLHSLKGEVYRLTPGDGIRIPRNTPHDLRNSGGEPLQILVVFSSPNRQTVLLEERDSPLGEGV